ncbi:MAG: hypothetical protein LUC97_03245 [Clostridiales bacterium]|nr:hypothetical protein [Clostridiales bacterium]
MGVFPRHLWRNVRGSDEFKDYNCGTWKQHWVNYNISKQEWPDKCSRVGCENKAEVGAHVRNHEHFGRAMYIIPLCSKCNQIYDDDLTIKRDVAFAPASKARTCGE